MSRQARLERTRTGLVIGCAYIAPAPASMSRDAELLQSALIDPPLPLFERVLDSFNRNFGRLMVFVSVTAALLGMVFK